MARYKPQERHSLLLPVVLSEQLIPGSFAFALDYLVDHELDLSAMDAEFRNEEVGASAYDPRVMLKIVLLAYSQGITSSRSIENICLRNVQFIAISGDSQPSHAHIAKFVSSLGEQIKPLFSQVLMTCDAQGLIEREMLTIDGVTLPSNASKERSGTHGELRHRARRLDKAANKHPAFSRSYPWQTIEMCPNSGIFSIPCFYLNLTRPRVNPTFPSMALALSMHSFYGTIRDYWKSRQEQKKSHDF